MLQGLGPALVAEMSGLPWKGPKDLGFTKEKWQKEIKESGRPPFKQLPMLVSQLYSFQFKIKKLLVFVENLLYWYLMH